MTDRVVAECGECWEIHDMRVLNDNPHEAEVECPTCRATTYITFYND